MWNAIAQATQPSSFWSLISSIPPFWKWLLGIASGIALIGKAIETLYRGYRFVAPKYLQKKDTVNQFAKTAGSILAGSLWFFFTTQAMLFFALRTFYAKHSGHEWAAVWYWMLMLLLFLLGSVTDVFQFAALRRLTRSEIVSDLRELQGRVSESAHRAKLEPTPLATVQLESQTSVLVLSVSLLQLLRGKMPNYEKWAYVTFVLKVIAHLFLFWFAVAVSLL